MKKLLLLSALLIFACSSDDEGNPCIYVPMLTTEAVTNITETSATLNGDIAIVSENCEVAPEEMQGFVYSTNPSPTYDDNVEVVYGTNISTSIESLQSNTTYYVRAFLTNIIGEFYGNEVSFMTDAGEPADCDVVYLDSNGITIKACDDALVGESGFVNGSEYTIVSASMLANMAFNPSIDLAKFCTSRIVDMSYMFSPGLAVNSDIGNWDVSNVINMEYMFAGNSSFNRPLSSWDVSNVTNMQGMFGGTIDFNNDIRDWDVSNVTNMEYMFSSSRFNQDISNWDVSNVTNMNNMFSDTNFNRDVGDWDVSNVTNMQFMFLSSNFNRYIGDWDVSNVTNMQEMFNNNASFNQDLSSWVTGNVTVCDQFSDNTPQWTLPQPNFTNCNP